MTDADVNRALGRLEGKVEGMVATLSRVDERSAARDDTIEEIRDDIAALKDHAKKMVEVSNQFTKLQQAIRDGKMQAKGFSIGLGFAAAAGGATVATFFKSIVTWITSFFAG